MACNAESNMRKGDQFFAVGEYYDAASEYRAAYSKTAVKDRDKRGERALKMAECYRRMNYTAKAIGAYQNGIRYTEKAMTDRQKAEALKAEAKAEKADKKEERQKKVSAKNPKKKAEVESRAARKRNRDSQRDSIQAAKDAQKDSLKAVQAARRDSLKVVKAARRDSLKAAKAAQKDSLKTIKAAREDSLQATKGPGGRWFSPKKVLEKLLALNPFKKEARMVEEKANKAANIAVVLAKKETKDEHIDPDSLAEVTILEATLQLARLQHKNGDYKGAVKSYETYLEGARTNTAFSPQQDTIAMNGLIGARQALMMKQKPTLHTIKKEAFLNSRRADFSPALLGDDSDMLYWTSTRPQATGDDLSGITGTKFADIFWSKKDDKGKWSAPEKVEGDLNSEFEEGVCCFTPDGKTMYLTRCTTDPDYPRYAQIFTSQRSDASWGKPQELKISKDTLSCFAHPAVSPDGLWLYFVSDMPGGHGGKDIWRISVEGKTLGGVENLGAPINTPGDELFPTFRPNGELYFSSDGHPGMGGLDLFVAQQDSVTEQWTVRNLGYPMNSAGDDFGMTFEGQHNRGYFSSNRGDARGWDHIWSFECPEVTQTVTGWVYEKDGYELPAGLVYMIGNDGTNQKLSVRSDGSFTAIIQPHVEYVFLGTCKGYLNHAEQLSVDTSSVSQEYVLQFPLASITAPVLVRNVFYEFDSAELTDDSTAALDSLAALLQENPNVTIELSSHCDYRGNDQYNERLSQRRAESVVNYLIEHGVASDRLTPKGYGENRPKIVKRRIAEQHDFLHEGDTLTEAFIRALDTEDKQEICNALNRRTEFRVLRTTYGLFEQFQQKAKGTKEEEQVSLPQ